MAAFIPRIKSGGGSSRPALTRPPQDEAERGLLSLRVTLSENRSPLFGVTRIAPPPVFFGGRRVRPYSSSAPNQGVRGSRPPQNARAMERRVAQPSQSALLAKRGRPLAKGARPAALHRGVFRRGPRFRQGLDRLTPSASSWRGVLMPPGGAPRRPSAGDAFFPLPAGTASPMSGLPDIGPVKAAPSSRRL